MNFLFTVFFWGGFEDLFNFIPFCFDYSFPISNLISKVDARAAELIRNSPTQDQFYFELLKAIPLEPPPLLVQQQPLGGTFHENLKTVEAMKIFLCFSSTNILLVNDSQGVVWNLKIEDLLSARLLKISDERGTERGFCVEISHKVRGICYFSLIFPVSIFLNFFLKVQKAKTEGERITGKLK